MLNAPPGGRSARELVGGGAAIAAPAIMWAEFLGFGLRTPGYSVITRAASDLGARGAPHAGLFALGFFYVAGVLTVVLGVTLAVGPRQRSTWRVGAQLVVLEGVLLVLAGAFPENLTAPGGTWPHQLFATACFATAAVSPAVLAAGASSWTLPLALRRLWLACAAALLLLFAGDIVVTAFVHFPDGLFQRPFGVVLTGWFVTTGLWLLRGSRGSGVGSVGNEPPRGRSHRRSVPLV